jgi:cytochrome c-550 PedF
MTIAKTNLLAAVTVAVASMAHGHGDVAPQPVNTDALPAVGEEWLTENPYRELDADLWKTAIDIGSSGYNQNCARCHGLGAVSGGLAPDLRYLEAEEYGDEWFMERYIYGYTQNGITKMPAFGELLGQEAAWAIRLYVETRPGEGALDDFQDRLKAMRDELEGGTVADEAAMKAELEAIAAEVYTESGAPLADSIAWRAAALLDGTPESYKAAAETLTVGLSAAH